MEFGEKLKRIREERGMTQQALAEQVFVTRQAVSRWENSARYPDLITVRRLAKILDVSLDELLSEEEPGKTVKKIPVLEDRRGERIQTAVYIAAALPYLMHVLGMIWEIKKGMMAEEDITYAVAEAALSVVCLLVMVFGAYRSVVGQMNSRMICVVIAAYFLTGTAERFLVIASRNVEFRNKLFNPHTVTGILLGAVCLTMIAVNLYFYLSEKIVSPRGVFLSAALLFAGGAVLFAGRLWYLYMVGQSWTTITFYDGMIRFFCNTGFAGLMFIQSREYYRKKRLAAQEEKDRDPKGESG